MENMERRILEVTRAKDNERDLAVKEAIVLLFFGALISSRTPGKRTNARSKK